jgi:hypothetical protein
MSIYPIPSAAQVKDLLGMLFDGTAVKPASKLDVSAASTSYVGVYISDGGEPVALCACNLDFAAGAGAALSILPPNAVKDAIKTKSLPAGPMQDNLRELMNICTRLVIKDGSPHLRLQDVYPAKSLPAPAAAVAVAATGRADFEVALGRYGSGVLSLMAM